MRWLIPWFEHHADPAQRAFLLDSAPLPFKVLLWLNRRRFARLHRRVFG